MGLDKRPSSQPGNVTVIFRVPPEAAATTAELLGDFTDWTPVAMESSDDGGHLATLDLQIGSAYRFRYLLDGERWVNDWAADDYIANDYGSDDSIVDLTAVDAVPTPTRKAPAKRAKNVAKKVAATAASAARAANDKAEPAKRKRAPRKKPD
jgi:1,4-alpha-glucan branching enzyme